MGSSITSLGPLPQWRVTTDSPPCPLNHLASSCCLPLSALEDRPLPQSGVGKCQLLHFQEETKPQPQPYLEPGRAQEAQSTGAWVSCRVGS